MPDMDHVQEIGLAYAADRGYDSDEDKSGSLGETPSSCMQLTLAHWQVSWNDIEHEWRLRIPQDSQPIDRILKADVDRRVGTCGHRLFTMMDVQIQS